MSSPKSTIYHANFYDADFVMDLQPNDPARDDIAWHLANSYPYEHETSLVLRCLLRSGSGFIDIGAHVGYYTLFAASLVGPSGHVYAVEPCADTIKHLVRNISLNGWQDRVTIFETAVFSAVGERELWLKDDSSGGHALSHGEGRSNNIIVKTSTLSSILDDFHAKHPDCHIPIIKIDTEGAEKPILESGGSWITDGRISNIIAEANALGAEEFGYTLDSMVGMMLEHGYECYVMETENTRQRSGFVHNVLFSNTMHEGDLVLMR